MSTAQPAIQPRCRWVVDVKVELDVELGVELELEVAMTGGRKAELSSASGDLSISRRTLEPNSVIAHQSTD
ncbi:GM20387 [Drosophila sechellia]|uniref:GM20387 n=1 Tax=Drosophila sechellia TaxID=7238 RepID=B4HNX7_DROSE|nr:GM20387 [Drosophila sechellia]